MTCMMSKQAKAESFTSINNNHFNFDFNTFSIKSVEVKHWDVDDLSVALHSKMKSFHVRSLEGKKIKNKCVLQILILMQRALRKTSKESLSVLYKVLSCGQRWLFWLPVTAKASWRRALEFKTGQVRKEEGGKNDWSAPEVFHPHVYLCIFPRGRGLDSWGSCKYPTAKQKCCEISDSVSRFYYLIFLCMVGVSARANGCLSFYVALR